MREPLRMLMAGAVASLIGSAAWSAFAAPAPQTTGRDRAVASTAQSAPADPAAKQRRDTMMRAMAIDDQVTALTAEMNKATGQAKIDAMARLLTALVEHRSMMMQQMRMMQEDFGAQHEAMQHMRQMMHSRMANAPPQDVKK